MNKIDIAKKVIEDEITAIELTKNAIDESFLKLVDIMLKCEGKIVLTGIGKSGHICKKIVATMLSIGIQAEFLHPSEALHGDLGLVVNKDVVLAISHGGESEEIIQVCKTLSGRGIIILALTGNANSTLALTSDYFYCYPKFEEAFLNGLVPTCSTSVALVLGDALAVTVAKCKNFSEKDFALRHPKGLLGKKLLLKVKDIMHPIGAEFLVKKEDKVSLAMIKMCENGLGAVCVVDDNDFLCGILTDGDLKRSILNKGANSNEIVVDEIMSRTPTTTQSDLLITTVVKKFQNIGKLLSVLPVIENTRLVGVLSLGDIAREGMLI